MVNPSIQISCKLYTYVIEWSDLMYRILPYVEDNVINDYFSFMLVDQSISFSTKMNQPIDNQ